MLTFIFLFNAIRYLPLVEVSLITNTTPLVTALLAYFILGETLSLIEKLCLLISFGGVALLIIEKDYSSSDTTEEATSTAQLYALIMLIFVPFLISGVTISLRRMRGVNIHT